MPTKQILQLLSKQGEQLDTDIAQKIGISLTQAHKYLNELSEQGEVVSCQITRFVKGRRIEGVCFRLAGIIPKPAPGRKSRVQLTLSREIIKTGLT